MRLVRLTASTAALLFLSTALLAQQEATSSLSVVLDVGGTPMLVPIAIATEACDLDEAGVQQASQSRIGQSGLDDTAVQGMFATAGPTGSLNSTGVGGAEGTTGTAEMANDAATTADASNTPAPGGEPVDVDALGGTSDLATSGDAATDLNGVLDDAEATAADTTAAPDTDLSEAQGLDSEAPTTNEMLALAVCQVDPTRAGDFGISGFGNTVVDSTGQ